MAKRHATAAVIGAGDFIGAAIAKKFAVEGFSIFAGRRNADKLAPLVADIEAAGGEIVARGLDARKEDDITAFLREADAHAPAGMALALTRLIGELPFKAGSAPALIPADVAARHGASGSDFDARRASADVIAACAELRGLARDELAEAERRLNGSDPAILPAFIPLGPLRLDLDRLDRNAARPFEPAGEVSPLRRQWAIWRWARAR